jgi:hypothetical protein
MTETISWEEHAGENSHTGEQDPAQRYRLYRLCECPICRGTGKDPKQINLVTPAGSTRCKECRGEGRVRELMATCSTSEAVGVALVTLGREGEFTDCPIGLLDSLGEINKKWLVLPWGASPRQVSDAGRMLSRARARKGS